MASAGPASVHPVVKPGDTIFLRLVGGFQGFRVSAGSIMMMVSIFFLLEKMSADSSFFISKSGVSSLLIQHPV